jgi:hypothetical protein
VLGREQFSQSTKSMPLAKLHTPWRTRPPSTYWSARRRGERLIELGSALIPCALADRAQFAITHCSEWAPLPAGYQKIIVMPMTIAANAITAVAIQPIHRRPSWMGNFPMILGLPVMCIMVIMIGTATTPLITALQ